MSNSQTKIHYFHLWIWRKKIQVKLLEQFYAVFEQPLIGRSRKHTKWFPFKLIIPATGGAQVWFVLQNIVLHRSLMINTKSSIYCYSCIFSFYDFMLGGVYQRCRKMFQLRRRWGQHHKQTRHCLQWLLRLQEKDFPLLVESYPPQLRDQQTKVLLTE